MAINADQLKAIQYAIGPQWQDRIGDGGGGYSTPTAAFNLDGYNYAPTGDGGFWRFRYDPNIGSNASGYNGQQYEAFDANGNKLGDGTLNGYGEESFMNKWGPFLMTAAGFAPAVFGAAGAAGGAGGLESLGMQGLPSYSSLAAGDAAALEAAGLAPAAAGTGAMGAAGATGAVGAAGAAGTGAAGSAGGAGLLGSGGVLGTGLTAGQALGLGATALGALAGSQGVKTTQNTSQKTDPRVDPYIFGQGGLLNLTQQQLANATNPSTLAGWESLKQKGMGLLNQPVAQNGFNLLTKGRYQ